MLREAKDHSDDDNARWCWARASEWVNWPMFVSPVLVPLLLLLVSWRVTLVVVFLGNWVWNRKIGHDPALTKPDIAEFGPAIPKLKWFIFPLVAAYLAYRGEYLDAIAAVVWPFLLELALLIPITKAIFMPAAPITAIQHQLMVALGYEAASANPPEEEPRPAG